MEFPGIQPESLWLLAENRFQNDKTFYEQQKPALRAGIIEPMYALIRDLAPVVQKIDRTICVEPLRCLSRVRRDTRFTADKMLYREHMWFALHPPKDGYKPYPFFWFEVAPQGYCYGSGIWNPTPRTMALWRKEIDRDPTAFLRAVSPVLKGGYEVDCERYKRPKKEGLPKKIEPWYNLKEIYAGKPWQPVEQLQDGQAIAEELAHAYRKLAPFYHLLAHVVSREMIELE